MSEMIATREAYGRALERLGGKHPEIVVLDADLSKSTMTIYFAKKYPERFYQMGIAESNMVCTAAGLASCGKKPFVSSFAMFCSRAWEQIRNTIARGGFPVTFCLSHAGLTVGEDGASAQACEDIAIMRAIPGMKVIVPADAVETEQVIEYLVNNLKDGPCYVRLTRNKVPVIHPKDYRFQFGKAELIRQGADVTYIACGQMVFHAMQAASKMAERGIQVRVINMSTIKPMDEQTVLQAARETKRILTIEEHSIIGGLGEAVCAITARDYPVPVYRIGVQDKFGESGTPEQLLKRYGLDVDTIVQKTCAFIGLPF
jgi:transketolase